MVGKEDNMAEHTVDTVRNTDDSADTSYNNRIYHKTYCYYALFLKY